MKIITGPKQKPPADQVYAGFYGDNFERGLDPWHESAMPEHFRWHPELARGPRKEGWFLLDAYGNEIAFIKDGTEFEI